MCSFGMVLSSKKLPCFYHTTKGFAFRCAAQKVSVQHYQEKVFIHTHTFLAAELTTQDPPQQHNKCSLIAVHAQGGPFLRSPTFLFIYTLCLTLMSTPCTLVTTCFACMIAVIQDISTLTCTTVSPNITRFSFLFCQGKLSHSVKLHMAENQELMNSLQRMHQNLQTNHFESNCAKK